METWRAPPRWRPEKKIEHTDYCTMLECKWMTENRVDDFLDVLKIGACWSFCLSSNLEYRLYI